MAQIGRYNKLKVIRKTGVGYFLDGGEIGDILMPYKYATPDQKVGDVLEVIVYLDQEERPVATTEKPFALIDEFAFLEVVDVLPFGAFLDWGLTKQLFVPLAEMTRPLQLGQFCMVYIYFDEFSSRIVASTKLEKFLDKRDDSLKVADEVDLMIWAESDLGYKAIVNYSVQGLIYRSDVFKLLLPGQKLKGYVSKIREDGKIDISLEKIGHLKLDDISERLLDILTTNPQARKLNDKSDPDLIYQLTHLSKKNFKKALGILYKAGRIDLSDKKGDIVIKEAKA